MELFQAIGGTRKCRQLSKAFYARVAQDPLLRPLFPGKTFTCAIEEFSAFLIQFLGGPAEDSQRRRYMSLRESHQHFKLNRPLRDAWLSNMMSAIDEVSIAEPARSALGGFFDLAAHHVTGDKPASQNLHPELARRWERQRNLEEAVAAIREQDTKRAIALTARCSPAVVPGLLAAMIESGDEEFLNFVHGKVSVEPALVFEPYNGRQLLHVAAAAGDLPTTKLLLSLGADPNALDGGRHTPLYSVGNQCLGAKCVPLIHELIRGGAKVDACDGVTHSTPLHMAARRGNAAAAQALVEAGANVRARDTRGNTPLQRAVNCRKMEVAELLRSYL